MHRHAVVSLQMRLPSVKPLLLVCAMLMGGCTSPGSPAFRTGYVFPGSENIISLESFWFNVEGGGVSQADKITPEYDPIGGYLFLYWLDDHGNVCSGQPGVSGQPGAVYVAAFKQQAWDLAGTDASITSSQMVDFQKIPYRVAPYIAGTQASGLHFVQFGNRLIRMRADGKVYRFSSDELQFSVPLIISIDTTNTIFPIHPDKQVNCSQGYALPLPDPGRPAGQNPDMCGTRAFPVSNSMDYQESIKFCMINLPHGTTWWNIP